MCDQLHKENEKKLDYQTVRTQLEKKKQTQHLHTRFDNCDECFKLDFIFDTEN